MSDKFTVEIITPDQTILKSEASEVTIPSYDGMVTSAASDFKIDLSGLIISTTKFSDIVIYYL